MSATSHRGGGGGLSVDTTEVTPWDEAIRIILSEHPGDHSGPTIAGWALCHIPPLNLPRSPAGSGGVIELVHRVLRDMADRGELVATSADPLMYMMRSSDDASSDYHDAADGSHDAAHHHHHHHHHKHGAPSGRRHAGRRIKHVTPSPPGSAATSPTAASRGVSKA
eukprot:c1948_g1_i1.p1 GENE.c1948_g1_i1~~c1948_g1_i1.p1  ORF type:complete len:194 (-),score=1.81 c1948_g1_i1:48-545(-)